MVSEVDLESAIELYQLSELAKPENARWFALLIDAEGATGWVHLIKKENRIDEEYRYVYRYYIPYITVSMSKRESRKTIEEGARLAGVAPRSWVDKKTREQVIGFHVDVGRCLLVLKLLKPNFVKFHRMANLIPTLFKYRVLTPEERFKHLITILFGKWITSKEANEILLDLTEPEFEQLLKTAEKLAHQHLR
jgi:hypothetical protein